MSTVTQQRTGTVVVEHELTANWGNILVLLASLPMVAFALLNPVSLFLIGCGLFWGVVLSFLPKLVYFLLLELYIARGKGSEFYHTHHSRRVSVDPSVSVGYIESLVVRFSSLFGGVEVHGRKMVAQARKKYADQPLPLAEAGRRVLGLPGYVWPCGKQHVAKFFSLLSHLTMRWIALNVVARLYTKRLVDPSRE